MCEVVTVRIMHGDCREVLATLPDASVQMVCTSPPYYQLRDAGDSRQIGMEDSPANYIEQLVTVFREVRRVLRDDGTVWLNLGDSYTPTNRGERAKPRKEGPLNTWQARSMYSDLPTKRTVIQGCAAEGFKDKDRMMVPARVALALHADGWWLRDEIIWHKPRPTPNPVKDRTVAAHEMIYLLAKRPSYYFDWEAIEEPSSYPGVKRKAGKAFRDLKDVDPNAARKRPSADREMTVRETRRKRSVWSVCPAPYTDGHFSTMPPEIAETCIRAGSRVGDTVLDPFYGAGTTGIVADRLQRHAIGIELIAAHKVRSSARLVRDAGMFADIATD